MPYRDTWATCKRCGKQFIFTVEEQRRLDKMGLEVEPTLCPDCQEGKAAEAVKPETGKQQGIVKWYEPKKRYGFITMRSGNDIFFHRNAIVEGDEGDFTEGATVTFEVTESDKGPEAADVALVE
ncbi:MAG: cold shock domain-containing protein [Chloroflexota bacterium]|nr:cold shock domain-containing protein [Chloroflexota bacterium]